MGLRILLLNWLAIGIGCSSPELGESQTSDQPSNSSSPESTDHSKDESKAVESQPFRGTLSEHSFKNTGVKSDVLLGILNINTHVPGKFHHNFKHFVDVDEHSVYKDEHSSLVLVLVGPKDDLLLILMSMPTKDFIGEQPDGTPTGEGAAAFGRCVQRLGLAIDPSWVQELYAWMNNKIMVALIGDNGAQLGYKHLNVIFNSDKAPNDEMMINFAIGVREQKN